MPFGLSWKAETRAPPLRKWRESIEHPLLLVSLTCWGLTVDLIGALPNLDDVTVRIAHVAANLAVLGDWFGDELRSPAFPQFIARLEYPLHANSKSCSGGSGRGR